MITHVQQIVSTTLLLLFGVLALLVWRRFRALRRDRAALAWALTAANFLVVGTCATAQSVVSAAAPVHSPVFRLVYAWSPAANLGRGVVSVVFGVLLLLLLVSRRRRAAQVAAASPAVLLATALAATLSARLLPYPSAYAFLTQLALVTALTAVVLMAALFAAVYNDGLDRLLWMALAVYMLKETIAVSFLAVMAAWTMTYAATYFTVFYWVGTVLTACMVALAARRLQLAAGGRRVPAPFEGLHALRRPAHG
ncbi:MAG: hypothetical protein KY467_11980 [Gemmatimonadetes bacterium]|nr:hypothetical protein [Gemmatimonadota bacterium]